MTVTREDVLVALPPYSGPIPTCPKCGLSGNQRGEHPETARTRYVEPIEGEQVTLTRTEDGAPEYLTRTCVRCGYSWAERCVDAED